MVCFPSAIIFMSVTTHTPDVIIEWSILYRTTVLRCIVLCCIVLYCIVLYFIVLHRTNLCCIVLNCTVLCCTVLHCIVLYCTMLHCTVFYCTAWTLHCNALRCTVTYCIVLHRTLCCLPSKRRAAESWRPSSVQSSRHTLFALAIYGLAIIIEQQVVGVAWRGRPRTVPAARSRDACKSVVAMVTTVVERYLERARNFAEPSSPLFAVGMATATVSVKERDDLGTILTRVRI